MMVVVCGCSGIPGKSQNTTEETSAPRTPTLPNQYIAGGNTPLTTKSPVIATQTSPNASSLNIQSAVMMTITTPTISTAGANVTNAVVGQPISSFYAIPTSGLVPLTVSFNDASSNQPTTWNWQFGDGNTSTLQNPVYTYSVNGTYTITLTVSNNYGSSSSSQTNYITVESFPSVSFSAVVVSAGSPNPTVIFTDNSIGYPNPSTWYWNFGDGHTNTQPNPSHQYGSVGVYMVNHSATNAEGTGWLNMSCDLTVSEIPCH
jgi:PKD repeat protein